MPKEFAVRYSANGVHLFNRESGLNILCDEIKVPPKLWSAVPRQISIAVTNACDLACSFCYAPKSNHSLEYSSLCRWLKELNTAGCQGVGFGGGEPLLYPQLANICEFATQNTQLAVSFTTHGHRINERLAKELKGNVNFIRVSVDGVGSAYEAIRGRLFGELCKRLDLLRTISSFGFNCVVNADTIHLLDELAEFAILQGASQMLLLPQQATARVGAAADQILQRLDSWIAGYRGSIPLSIGAAAVHCLPHISNNLLEDPIDAYAHIDAAGILRRTSYEPFGVLIGQRSIIEAMKLLT